MKKIIFIVSLFLISLNIAHANTIYDMDIDVYIDKNGDAKITETWDVDGSDGTEWYKAYNNLGYMDLLNFKVSMDGIPLTRKNWDINESLSEKSGYYGINSTSNGIELCFGKSDYKRHTFVLEYTLADFVFNTKDAQVIYFNFVDKLSNVKFKKFSVDINSYYSFPNTLEVWGYGYKGYAYVENGTISMSNEGSNMKNQYGVLLVKFPLNTFNSNTSYSKFKTFNDVYELAEQEKFDYDYNKPNFNFVGLLPFLNLFLNIVILILPFAIVNKYTKSKRYGFINNKTVTKDNTNLFRDIPCNKNIYYANALIRLNNPNAKKENILGAILLKWIKEQKVIVKNDKKIKLIFTVDHAKYISNPSEHKLYNMMYKASEDGTLEANELKRWAKKNYTAYLNLFDKISNDEINKLQEQGYIRKRKNKQECKYVNVMEDNLYNDYQQLYGLKLFLEEFSTINTKQAIEVNLWEEYLMFAYLFGIADKVAKQFKNMYPEIAENSDYVDLDTITFLNDLSYISYHSASSARSAAASARAYSSGGGGFSSGGGGGGSFGGGGGGSR